MCLPKHVPGTADCVNCPYMYVPWVQSLLPVMYSTSVSSYAVTSSIRSYGTSQISRRRFKGSIRESMFVTTTIWNIYGNSSICSSMCLLIARLCRTGRVIYNVYRCIYKLPSVNVERCQILFLLSTFNILFHFCILLNFLVRV